MKTVTLFRHAKSGWKNNPLIEDKDRPLAARGMKDAPRMGRFMRKLSITPDIILCSPSVRTRQTLSLAQSEAFDRLPRTIFDERLYDADPDTILAVLRELPDTVNHAMVVGHNPGMQQLAAEFVKANAEQFRLFTSEFPTAALASFSFAVVTWKELSPDKARLMLYKTPR